MMTWNQSVFQHKNAPIFGYKSNPVPKIKETPVVAETLPDSFQIIRQPFVNQGLSKPVCHEFLNDGKNDGKNSGTID
jgi:hypothetical protein